MGRFLASFGTRRRPSVPSSKEKAAGSSTPSPCLCDAEASQRAAPPPIHLQRRDRGCEAVREDPLVLPQSIDAPTAA